MKVNNNQLLFVILLPLIICCCSPTIPTDEKNVLKGPGDAPKNKYTKADYIFVTSALEISQTIFGQFSEVAKEFKKYPNTDFDLVFERYEHIINEVDKANRLVPPDNLNDTYRSWITCLNDYKAAVELSMIGFKNKDINIISQSNKLLKSGTEKLVIATKYIKKDYEELQSYYNITKKEEY